MNVPDLAASQLLHARRSHASHMDALHLIQHFHKFDSLSDLALELERQKGACFREASHRLVTFVQYVNVS